MNLVLPNKVLNQKGKSIGTWTMVYDEGFEINLKKSKTKYFAFSKYYLKEGFEAKNGDAF